MTQVEGGLDEPEELEPEQGSLAPGRPGRPLDVSDWEQAAAARAAQGPSAGRRGPRRRASGRSSTRTTLDGIEVPPLGTPATSTTSPPPGAPDPRAGDGGTSAPQSPAPTRAARRGGPDRPRERRHLAVGAARLRARSRRPRRGARRRAARPRARRARRAPRPGRPPRGRCVALLGERGVDAGARHEPRAPTRSPTRVRRRRPAHGRDLADLVAVARLARDAGALGVVVDATAVHDLGASDAQELGYALAVGAAYLRALTAAGLDVDEAAGLVEFRLRRHRRAVPDHRQAARRTPALGPDARAQRRRRGAAAAPARGDLPADDEQVRPLGEHAAHHRRRVRRRRGRRRRRDRAAVRQRARPARTRSAAGSPATPPRC